MEDPYSQLEPENFAGIWLSIVVFSAMVLWSMTEDGTLAIIFVAVGLLLPLAGWLGKIIYDVIFDDPITRGFFAPVTGRRYGLYITGLWFLLGAGTFPLARRSDIVDAWIISALATLPILFGAFFLFRGIRAHMLAGSWRKAARILELTPDTVPDSALPRMHGHYSGRPTSLGIAEEGGSHITTVDVALDERSQGIEIASTESLYFRPYEGIPVADDELGVMEFRIYGADDAVASRLASQEFLQQLQILEFQTEELRIGPETASARQQGGTPATTELVYLASTLAEIADMIDEVQTELDPSS